jgi:hypothetical protein
MRIAVVGGGELGARLVSSLRRRRHDVTAVWGLNVGERLADAIAGSQVVIDVADTPSFNDPAMLEVFQTSCRNLLVAEEAAGVRHHVALFLDSTEELIRRSRIPHTVLRTTQSFELMDCVVRSGTDGCAMRWSPPYVQPSSYTEVAGALADLALAPPRNDVIDLGGPAPLRPDALH